MVVQLALMWLWGVFMFFLCSLLFYIWDTREDNLENNFLSLFALIFYFDWWFCHMDWNLLWLAEAVLTCLWRRQYKLEMNRSWQTGRWKLWGWTCLHILTGSDASLTKQRETSSDTLYTQTVAAAHTLWTWCFILRLCCLVWPICAVIGFLLFLALFFDL